MKLVKHFIVFLLTLLLLNACSTTTDPADAYKGETTEHIFQKGEEALRDKNYSDAIKRFEALDAQYPFGPQVELVHLHVIYAYYMTGDYASAESAADRFIHLHPRDDHVDYAYYMRGLSNYYQNLGVFERLFTIDLATRDLTQIKKSFMDFSTLVHSFPNSPYAPAAYQYMIYLRNVLASHELEVANYYFKHKAYIAAANRATLIVRYYQGAPVVPQALSIMYYSYQGLQLNELAANTLQLIQYNHYPLKE